MSNGFLTLVLHAHLPFVRHPEYDCFFEENWFFEALTESYVPLAAMLDRLLDDRINYRLTLSLSPTLITLLRDDLLRSRYLNHLSRLLELADKEIARTRGQDGFHALAHWYRKHLDETIKIYRDRYQGDLLAAFSKHQASGCLELITTAATHGYLPLLNNSSTAVRCQINTGIETFYDYFGYRPTGFWLPECGYYPGLEDCLKDAGVNYFFVDSHGILDASETTRRAVYAPIDCGNRVCAFGRDPQSSWQVWSAEEGYPGDAVYREYYRDIGFDLDLDYIAPYILNDTTRVNTGFKYHQIDVEGAEKGIYQPDLATEKAHQHAAHFIRERLEQIENLQAGQDLPPQIVAPYDAELFGHWWFEGPHWLEQVLRLAARNENPLCLITCPEYLARFPELQQTTPSASSWGEQGYSSYWINESNDWIYPLIHRAAAEMEKLAADLQGLSVTGLQRRALNQALRSILLAQASDWPFILKSGTTVEYARKRLTDHLARFNYLHDCIRKNRIDERYLTALEILDDIFPNLDYRTYQPAAV